MLRALIILLAFQLAGEAAARGAGLPLPGPVLGMALLLIALLAAGRAPAGLDETAAGLLQHLSLLFVPASVGLVQHAGRIEAEWLAITAALLVSTVLAIAAAAATFQAVARWTGRTAVGDERTEGR